MSAFNKGRLRRGISPQPHYGLSALQQHLQILLRRGDRGNMKVFHEIVQYIRREERRERRPEADTLDAEVQEGEIPGEAVYTNSGSVSSLSGARLLKEQTRAKNKETLLEIINNANIAENQKQEAVDEMIALTDLTERETAAEILLETRGYADAVVTITDESADVVVGMSVLSDAQCAQIEDIVARKTGIAAQNIVINPLSR